MQRAIDKFKSVIMLLIRMCRDFNKSVIIMSLLFESITCSPVVTEASECGHRKDYPIILKKRVKRFLFPQLLILNLNNQGCGCRNANRYRYGVGGGLPYGGGVGGRHQLVSHSSANR